MLFGLQNKVIVITGGAGLLGSQFCEVIARFGGIPVILDNDLYAAKALAGRINTDVGAEVAHFACDIGSEEEVKCATDKILSKYGSIYGLINNAARNPKVANDVNASNNQLEHFCISEWSKDLRVGLTGAFLCAKHIGTAISHNENGGVIINISSDLGIIAPNQNIYIDINDNFEDRFVKPVSYSVVKSGLIGLTRYLSTYWSTQNVRCNAICPAGVFQEQPSDFVAKIEDLIPLKRMAKAHDYNSTVVWMLAEESSFLNGAIVSVDGGRTAW